MEKTVITLDDLPALQRKVASLKEKRDQAKGAKNQLLRRLKTEHGCQSLKEAKRLLETLMRKENRAAIEYTKKKTAFEKKWKKELKDLK